MQHITNRNKTEVSYHIIIAIISAADFSSSSVCACTASFCFGAKKDIFFLGKVGRNEREESQTKECKHVLKEKRETKFIKEGGTLTLKSKPIVDT